MTLLSVRGLSAFYVQSHGEGPEFVAAVGELYRGALESAAAGRPIVGEAAAAAVARLAEISPRGLCNGYYFESAGQRYVGAGECGATCRGGEAAAGCRG